jgi:DNA polymerase II small subunit
MDKLNLINQCFEKKILLNKDIFELKNFEEILDKLNDLDSNNSEISPILLILNKDNYFLLEYFSDLHDLLEFDKQKVDFEKNQELDSYNSFLSNLKQKLTQKHSLTENIHPLTILTSCKNETKKYEVKDFTKIFVSRYKFIEGILRNRQELTNILSINKILDKKERETVSLIGIVSEINQTRAGNIILNLEDLTGQIKILIRKDKTELYKYAKDIVFDEVIGITGVSGKDIVFAENIIWPEIPADRKLKKYSEEIYALFLSDIHVGSTNFLTDEFNKFLNWINGEVGNTQQKEIAKKVKYIFIAGDIVDGVGIYPNQDKELTIKDIYQQYQVVSDLLKKIPLHIQIIICPGNHDSLILAEPQPVFNIKYVQPLLQLPNVTLVNNPALINVCRTDNFSGFDVLLYHGYSFDYYVNNVDSLRSSGGYNRADLIMKFLLKKRHLAPSFTSTPYFPTPEDFLLIKKIPDFFITGHIHYAIAANHRNVTMISGSCWQSKTSFQEKVGHEPQPARVPIVNLKTREIKILKFI